MKQHTSILLFLAAIIAGIFSLQSCVHDDEYKTPDLTRYECQNLTPTMTLAQLKAMPENTEITQDAIVEAYVSSTDETGNIYKTIYVQDNYVNPTHGLAISVDMVNTYTKFPQGSKIYIRTKGLAIGSYGGVPQLGYPGGSKTLRIPENKVKNHLVRSCYPKVSIVPTKLTLDQMKGTNTQVNNLLGALIIVENAEFADRVLCSTFADPGTSTDKMIVDPTTAVTTRVIRTSGFASFANQTLPSGNGSVTAIFSKYNSTYQLYLNKPEDIRFNSFPRLDGIQKDPCKFDPQSSQRISIRDLKQLSYVGNYSTITQNLYVKAVVTANDETGNFYKQIYIQDETGGIGLKINKNKLFQDYRFMVGRTLFIKLDGLNIGKSFGETQLGMPYNNNLGGIEEQDLYKFVFNAGEGLATVTPIVKNIEELTPNDVGTLVKIPNVQFSLANFNNNDLTSPKTFTDGTNYTIRTLENCAGSTLNVSTSKFANFANNLLEAGRGYAIGIYTQNFNNYNLMLVNALGADLDDPRCDGTTPPTILVFEGFDSNPLIADWLSYSVTGDEKWDYQQFGNPKPSVVMKGYNGGNKKNRDYLISKEISLTGYSQYYLSFDSDVKYNGEPLKVLITTNYTGNPETTQWTQLDATLDSNSNDFNTWTNSGSISLAAFKNKKVRVAFLYNSSESAAPTWQIDNFKIVVR